MRRSWLPFIISLSILIGLGTYGTIRYIQITHKGNSSVMELAELEKKSISYPETSLKVTDTKPETTIKEEVIAVNAGDITRINPSTRMVFQDYYTLDDTIEISEGEPAYNIINMTREQLIDYYHDWQILSFANEKVVLRRTINKRNPKGYYMVKEKDGNIAVYYDYTNDLTEAFSKEYKPYEYSQEDYNIFQKKFLQHNEAKYLRETLDMPVTVLPDEEACRLEEGILIYSEEELIKLLENYTS